MKFKTKVFSLGLIFYFLNYSLGSVTGSPDKNGSNMLSLKKPGFQLIRNRKLSFKGD